VMLRAAKSLTVICQRQPYIMTVEQAPDIQTLEDTLFTYWTFYDAVSREFIQSIKCDTS